MRFDVITLFAGMFEAITRHGVSARAHARGQWQLACWNPRDFTHDAHRTIDDRPYGGGPGMVMMAEPLAAVLAAARSARQSSGEAGAAGGTEGNPAPATSGQGLEPGGRAGPVIALSPQGRPITHAMISGLHAQGGGILICGRYEGIDQRLLDREVDEQWSCGDFVLSGGELPAMAIIDAVVRLIPGVLNHPESAQQESFATGLLDHPHFTRPEVLDGVPVPPVLLSGHHADIARWRRDEALRTTLRQRPDLIESARRDGRLSRRDEQVLAALGMGSA